MKGLGGLRPIADTELDLMRSWRNAPAVRENMYTRHEISLDEHLRWWNQVCQRVDHRYFMYEFAGHPSGIVGFTGIDRVNANSAWAFYAAPAAPKGTGSRMEMLALDHAFSELALHKLYCEVLAFNTPVIKLHQKFGFQVEGVFRRQHRINGTWVDIFRLGILAEEWAVNREQLAQKIISTVRV